MTIVLGTMILCSFSLLTSSENNDQTNIKSRISVLPIPDSLFHSGDLIFRDGRGFISNAFRRLSLTDPRYSHAGIIHRENGKIFVYHIIGDEGSKNNSMRKDMLIDFCSPLIANSIAVYRTDQDSRSIDSLAGFLYSQKISFDPHFDLTTDDKMYCTELLYKILTNVSGKNNFLPLTTFSGIKYAACDNIYLSPHAKKVYSQDYITNASNEK